MTDRKKKPKYPPNPDAPMFTPELWVREGSKTEKNPKGLAKGANCYQYALGGTAEDGSNIVYDEYAPEPGQLQGLVMGGKGYTKEVMRKLVTADKVKIASTHHDHLPLNKPGHYVIGIYVKDLSTPQNPDGEQDYHFVRQDSDGGWSEKPGRENYAMVDRLFEPAADGGYRTLPKSYGENASYQFVGYGYIPKEGIDAGMEIFLIPQILKHKAVSNNACVVPNKLFAMATNDRTNEEQDATFKELKLLGDAMKKHNIPEASDAYADCLAKFNQRIISKRPKPLTPTPDWP